MTDLSRRLFAESLAAVALAPILQVAPGSIRVAAWTEPISSSPPEKAGALAKALTEAIRTQYGSRLSAKDLRTIAQQVQHGLERVDQLKKLELANGDEPDFVFSPEQPATGSHD